MKDISCPHCKKNLTAPINYRHDKDLNMVCGYCSGVVFAATRADETKNKAAFTTPPPQSVWQRKDCLPIKINAQSAPVLYPPPVPYGRPEDFMG